MQQTTDKINFLTDAVPATSVFTPEQFSDEHKMLDDMARKFVYQSIRPLLPEIEEKHFEHSVALIKEAADLGLVAADIPEQYGGLGLGKISAAIISERMADSRSFSITFGGQTGIGGLPIAYFGNDAQKAKYLPPILSGEKITAYALTEPASGTDALGALTNAVLSEDGTHYILTGEKQWISNSGFADYFIVYGKVDRQHFTCFTVEKEFEGVSISAEEKKVGLHGSFTCSVILDQVKVPVENVLGEVGKGHIIAFNVLNIGRQKIASSSLGTMKRVIEISTQYANTRKQFKKPISSFPLIQQKLANMAIHTYVNESAIYRTAGAMEAAFSAHEHDEKIDYGKLISQFALECSINKVTATEMQDTVVDEGLQIHGGYGYMEEYEIATLYRDARVSRIFEGTNEINRTIIANTVYKTPVVAITSSGPQQAAHDILNTLRQLNEKLRTLAISQKVADINEEQEVAAVIADLTSAIYLLESAIIRTERYETPLKKLYTDVYAHEVSKELAQKISEITDYIVLDEQAEQLVAKLYTAKTTNIVHAKRQIAAQLIEQERYHV